VQFAERVGNIPTVKAPGKSDIREQNVNVGHRLNATDCVLGRTGFQNFPAGETKLADHRPTNQPFVFDDKDQAGGASNRQGKSPIFRAAAVPTGWCAVRANALHTNVRFRTLLRNRVVKPRCLWRLHSPAARLVMPAALNDAFFLCVHVIASERHGIKAFHELHLEDNKTLVAEYRFRSSKIELPHPTQGLRSHCRIAHRAPVFRVAVNKHNTKPTAVTAPSCAHDNEQHKSAGERRTDPWGSQWSL
jgi:hypothetical protein